MLKKGSNLVSLFTIHKLAIYIGALLAIIITSPYIYGYLKFGSNFSSLISNDNLSYLREHTYSYSAQVNQILKGHLYGDAYIWEYRSEPSPFVGELASIIPIATISFLVNSVPNGFILSTFTFSVILHILLFAGLRFFKFPTYFSISAASSILIIPFLSSLLPYFSHNLTQITGGTLLPLFYFRIPNPLISSVYLFLSLFSTIFILKYPSSKYFYLWPVIIGISLYSSSFVISTVAFALVLLAPRIYKNISRKKLLLSILIVTLLAIPYVFNFISSNLIFNTKEILMANTFEPRIMFPVQLRYILIAILLVWARKKDHLSVVIFAFILSAAILMELHQTIIGRNVQADHYISRILAPLATLSIIIIIYEKIKFKKKLIIVYPVLTLLVFIIGVNQQISWVKRYPNDFRQLSDRKILIDYINKNTDKNDVIATLDPDINDEIQANTGRWVYIAPGDRTFVAHNEQLTRICDLAILLNKNESNPEVKRAVYYSLALESENENKVSNSMGIVKDCIKRGKKTAHFKLNYLILEKNDLNERKIVKIN